MNDTDVRQVQEKTILNQTPYLLFYERIVEKKKCMIENHICQLKNKTFVNDKNANKTGTSSESTTDSDIYIEKFVNEKENTKVYFPLNLGY